MIFVTFIVVQQNGTAGQFKFFNRFKIYHGIEIGGIEKTGWKPFVAKKSF